jgi:hypothetical protein
MLASASPTAPQPTDASVAGLRRVEQVHVVVGNGRPVALVSGVGHRRPRQFRVSMATACRLVEAGVPCRFEYRDGATPSEVG